jgi:hypothetical protein
VLLRDLVVSVAFGDLVVELSGSMVFTDADNWELTGTVGALVLSSQITLTDLTVVLQSEEGSLSATISGSLAIGSGSIAVAGVYLGGVGWAFAGEATSLALTSSISLEAASARIIRTAGSVTVTFAGTLTVGAGSFSVSGSYLGANNWALAAAASSVALTSAMNLTNAQVAVCQLPTTPGATLAALPSLTLPAGVTALGCPAPTGAVTAVLSGTLMIGAGTVSVSGEYLGSRNWALATAADSLALTGSVRLADAQVVVCQLPNTGGATPAAPPSSRGSATMVANT